MKFRMGLNGMAAGQQQLAGGLGNGLQAFFMAPLMAAQAAGEAQKEQAQQAVWGAQQRQAEAHAALYGAQADDARDQLARRSFEQVLRNAALQNGVAPHQVPEFSNFATTGQLPGQYVQPPADLGGGPALPAPAYADPDVGRRIWQTLGITQNALAQGDKSVENVAKAAGAYQDQGLVDAATQAAGRGDDMAMSRLNTIRGKKEFTPFAAVENTGTALNQVTGAQPVANPALYALFGRGAEAQIGQRRASATASYASADSSRASADKTRADMEHGRATGNLQVVTGPNGEITVVDKRNLTAQPVLGADGRPVIKGTAGGGGKPLTEGQSKANLFGGRMTESDIVLRQLEDAGVKDGGVLKSTLQGVAGLTPFIGDKLSEATGSVMNVVPGLLGGPSADQQRVEQARRDFINAVLRKESGAVISPQEFANAEKQYFPQPGDSRQVIEQKRRNRQIATNLMLQEVPEAQRYRPGQMAGPQRGGATGSWAPDAGAPAAPQRTVQVNY